MKLERCPISPIGFAYVCAVTFSESFRSLDDLKNTVVRFERGECQLWFIKGRGFLILSWHEHNGFGWMEVEQGAGKCFYTRDGMNALKTVATDTGCDEIVCEAYKPLVVRLLERLGFSRYPNHMNRMFIRLEHQNVK